MVHFVYAPLLLVLSYIQQYQDASLYETHNLIPSCIIENITENSNKSESNVHSLRLSNVKFLSLPIFLEIL
jgi:hypothetical protein